MSIKEFNLYLIFKYISKAFGERNPKKQEALVRLIRRLQKGNK